jgi:hypothetical protein
MGAYPNSPGPNFPVWPPNKILPALPNPAVQLLSQNNITDIPCIQDEPDNGPAVTPACPGPTPLGRYEYITVPKPRPILPPESYYAAFGVYQQIESYFALLNAYTERIDLWNGVRVYRVPIQYIWKFPFDRIGPFLGYEPMPTFRFGIVDPTIGQSTVNFWAPSL